MGLGCSTVVDDYADTHVFDQRNRRESPMTYTDRAGLRDEEWSQFIRRPATFQPPTAELPTDLTCFLFHVVAWQSPSRKGATAVTNRIATESGTSAEESFLPDENLFECEEDVIVRIAPRNVRDVRLRIVERFVGKPNPIL